MKISRNKFGRYKDRDIDQYTLDNCNNLNVKIINLGGTISEIKFKGKNRVLGFNNIEDYINNRTYFGALVGRVAGRISNGEVQIDDEIFKLDQNEGSTCLHGGEEGFSFQVWELESEEVSDDFVSITLKYVSSNLECGFPGRLVVYAKYTLNKEDSIIIEYFAKTNKNTPITLTNHSFFNLNDDLSEDILDHKLKINADSYIRLDEKSIPIEIFKVEETPFDFRTPKKIKTDMDLYNKDLNITEGYDHPFILNNDSNQIELYSKKSDISLTIETTEPVVILYCSNKLTNDMILSGGEKTFKYQGVCLETQWYPDSLNHEFLPKNILMPNEEYYSKTSYKFK